MSIEEFVIHFLGERLDAPVSGDVPSPKPERFVTVEQTGSGWSNFIYRNTIAVQSWAESRAAAMALNEQVKAAMAEAAGEPVISRCVLDSDYNFPQLESNSPRYQAMFEIVHFL